MRLAYSFEPVPLQQLIRRIPHKLNCQAPRHLRELKVLSGIHRHFEDVACPGCRRVLPIAQLDNRRTERLDQVRAFEGESVAVGTPVGTGLVVYVVRILDRFAHGTWLIVELRHHRNSGVCLE